MNNEETHTRRSDEKTNQARVNGSRALALAPPATPPSPPPPLPLLPPLLWPWEEGVDESTNTTSPIRPIALGKVFWNHRWSRNCAGDLDLNDPPEVVAAARLLAMGAGGSVVVGGDVDEDEGIDLCEEWW